MAAELLGCSNSYFFRAMGGLLVIFVLVNFTATVPGLMLAQSLLGIYWAA